MVWHRTFGLRDILRTNFFFMTALTLDWSETGLWHALTIKSASGVSMAFLTSDRHKAIDLS